eukprot:g71308.t1
MTAPPPETKLPPAYITYIWKDLPDCVLLHLSNHPPAFCATRIHPPCPAWPSICSPVSACAPAIYAPADQFTRVLLLPAHSTWLAYLSSQRSLHSHPSHPSAS